MEWPHLCGIVSLRRGGVDELQDFQGTWQAVWLAEDGQKFTAEEVRSTTLTISGDVYTFHLPDQVFHGVIGRIVRNRNCGAMDFDANGPSATGKTCLGIYVLEDDELMVCVAPPGQDRPRSFARHRGGGNWVFLLKRYVPSRLCPVAEAVG